MDSVPAPASLPQALSQASNILDDFALWSPEGGEPSITPPSNSQTVTGSEDTFHICLGVAWGEAYDNLMATLELRKKEAQAGEVVTTFEWEGFRAVMSPGGFSAGGYVAYSFKSQGITFGVAEKRSPDGETPNVYVRLGSAVLMYNDGLEPCWYHVQEVIKTLGGTIAWDKVSRADLCVDLWGVEVRTLHDEYRQGCVTRARHKATYEWGLKLSGFVLGKGDVQLRVYDKCLESERNPMKWNILLARRKPADYVERVCTRVEYQVRREFLKSYGINSVSDWMTHRASLADYLVTKWARICKPITDRTHTVRSEMTALWEFVRESFAAWTGPGVARERTFRDCEWNPEGLFRMALGCVGRIVASRAEGELYDLPAFLDKVRQVFGDFLVGRDVDELQEGFISRWAEIDPELMKIPEIEWNFS